jgi:hypothetical protein
MRACRAVASWRASPSLSLFCARVPIACSRILAQHFCLACVVSFAWPRVRLSSRSGASIPLAEMGSIQLEFAALGALTHEPRLAELADGALRTLGRLPALYGLYPSRVRPHTGGPASKEVGFGAGSDSFYEV